MSKGWWYRASQEQKLAQVDGGIECGLTGREIAICVGLSEDRLGTVGGFARQHGRRLPGHDGLRRLNGRVIDDDGRLISKAAKFRRTKARAFLAGEAVDFWSEKPAHADELPEVAFE